MAGPEVVDTAQDANTAQPPTAAQPLQTVQDDTNAQLQTATPVLAPQIPQQPTILVPEKRGGLAGIIDDFRNAIAPAPTPQVYIDPNTGQRVVHDPAQTHGQQWRAIAGEALRGAGAGLAAGRGAGNGGKALFAGMQQEEQRQQQQQQEANQAADQDYQRQRQAKLDKANSQLLTTQIASNEFALTRQQVKATQDDMDFAQKEEDREQKLGSDDLGVYPDHVSLADIQKRRPEFWKDHYQDNSIVAIPNYDQDGKRNGVRVYLRQPGIGSQPVEAGTPAYRFVMGKTPQEPPHLETFTPSGTHTQNEYDTWNNAALKQMQDYQAAQAEQGFKGAQTAHEKAETVQSYAAARKDNAEASAVQNATSGAAVDSIAQGLVEGTIDPSQLSKRTKDYDTKLAAANAYSLKTTGKPFDIAKAQGDYKFATNPQTYNTLNYLNSLVGRDNASGNLGVLVNMSDKLGRTQFPPINDAEQWAKISAGNPQVAAYYGALTEVSDQIAKVLQGGTSGGGTSDAKLRQAQELLNKNFNAAQIRAVAGQTLRPLLANRKNEIIGDNRYLQRWHQPTPAQPATHIFSPSAWAKGNPGKDVNVALAQAKQEGYTITQ